MKLFFKRYLDFERKFGDAFSVENVKTKAMEYVESKAALSWQHCGMNCGEVLERSSLAERNWKITKGYGYSLCRVVNCPCEELKRSSPALAGKNWSYWEPR